MSKPSDVVEIPEDIKGRELVQEVGKNIGLIYKNKFNGPIESDIKQLKDSATARGGTLDDINKMQELALTGKFALAQKIHRVIQERAGSGPDKGYAFYLQEKKGSREQDPRKKEYYIAGVENTAQWDLMVSEIYTLLNQNKELLEDIKKAFETKSKTKSKAKTQSLGVPGGGLAAVTLQKAQEELDLSLYNCYNAFLKLTVPIKEADVSRLVVDERGRVSPTPGRASPPLATERSPKKVSTPSPSSSPTPTPRELPEDERAPSPITFAFTFPKEKEKEDERPEDDKRIEPPT